MTDVASLLINHAYFEFSSFFGLPFSAEGEEVSALLDTGSVLTTAGVPGDTASVVDWLEPGTKSARRPPQPEQNVTEFWQELH